MPSSAPRPASPRPAAGGGTDAPRDEAADEAGLRVVKPEQATARLHIRMPTKPPTPSAALRPHSTWEEAAPEQATSPFMLDAGSPARPTALPAEVAALTTATMLVPIGSRRRPRSAMLTTALPPDLGARGNAAAIEDAFTDTMEQIFGIDFTADLDPRFGVAGHQAAEPEYVAESFDQFEPYASEHRARRAAAAAAGGAEGMDRAAAARSRRARLLPDPPSASLWYAAPYGVPTQPAPYGGLGEDPAGSFIGAEPHDGSFPGAIFHDSTGETEYVDPSRTGQMQAIRLDDPWPAEPGPRGRAAVPGARRGGVGLGGPDDPGAATIVAPLAGAGAGRRTSGEEGRPRRDDRHEAAPAAGSATARKPAAGQRMVAGKVAVEPEDEPRSGRGGLYAVLALVAGLVVLYGVAAVAAGSVLGGRLPSGTRVLGVDIGGLSPAAARTKLDADLPATVDKPIRLVVGNTALLFAPQSSGLSVDSAATVTAARSGTANPFTVIPELFGAHHAVAPRVSVDQAVLGAALRKGASLYDVTMRSGSIVFHGTTPSVVAPRAGRSLDVAAAGQVITSGWLRGGGTEFQIASNEQNPPVTEAQLRAAVTGIAEPAVSAPITVVTGSVTSTLTPDRIAGLLTIAPGTDGRLTPRLDGTALRDDLSPGIASLEAPPVDASFDVESGRPVLVPARAGRGFAPQALAAAVEAVLPEHGGRVATVPIGTLPPRLTTAQAQALGVTDVLADQSGEVDFGGPESHNLGIAVKAVAGTVVQPGQTFDFDEAAGPYTAAKGYVSGLQPDATGKEVPAVSAGASGLATPLYQASLRAGLREVERHSYRVYQSLYPAGMDAEVGRYGGDLRFTNDLAHPVYVSADLRGDTLSVALLGEQEYDVAVDISAHQDVVAPPSSSGQGADCATSAGEQGFAVTVTQRLTDGATTVASRSYHTVYQPQAAVTCGGSGAADPTPRDASGGDPQDRPSTGSGDSSGSAAPPGGSGGSTAPPSSPSPTPSAPGVLGGL